MRWCLQLMIVGFSSWIILQGDLVWEKLWPDKFWSLKVAEMEKSMKKDHWHLKSVEWEVMKARVELSIAVSEAGDKAECLGMDSGFCIQKAKQRAALQLKRLMEEEAMAKTAYESSLKLLNEAKEKLSLFQKGS